MNPPDAPFRLLEAITPSKIGGAEVFVSKFCQILPSLGADVTLFCPANRPFGKFAQSNGLSTVQWMTHGKIDPITIIRLTRLLKNADIIHTHLSTASLLGAFAAKLAHKPSVAHVHGLNSARCFRSSSAVIAVSQAVKDHLVNQGMDVNKIRVWYNGVDLDYFQSTSIKSAKIALGYDATTPVLGIFGRLSKEKGQAVAISAMSEVLKSHPSARLMIVGSGADRLTLENMSVTLGISESIDFIDFREDIRPLMAACDAVIVPSLKEGLGLAALEAMAMEKPVIAARVGGLLETVLDGQTGVLFSRGDCQELSSAINRILSDTDTSRHMGRTAREHVYENFNFPIQAKRLYDILREMA